MGALVAEAVVPPSPPSNVFGNRGIPPVPPAGAAPPAPCLRDGGIGRFSASHEGREVFLGTGGGGGGGMGGRLCQPAEHSWGRWRGFGWQRGVCNSYATPTSEQVGHPYHKNNNDEKKDEKRFWIFQRLLGSITQPIVNIVHLCLLPSPHPFMAWPLPNFRARARCRATTPAWPDSRTECLLLDPLSVFPR